ncbi:MAG: CpaF family protein [Lachnospiraceae bacterium]|nr:CpaF family protein [Lachnospiraceae bacterium]
MDDRMSIRRRLSKRIEDRMDYLSEPEDEVILKEIDEGIKEELSEGYIPLKERLALRNELFHTFRKLDLLSELIEDSEVTEIMINGYDRIFIEKQGRLLELDKHFFNEEKLYDVIQQIVSFCNRMVNETHPIVDARLMDGSRVNVVLPPVALDGPVMTIRRFSKDPITMKKLLEFGSISEEAAGLLKLLVRAGYNIFISGGTGSGKTTFLNALSAFIPPDERVITIEDSAELSIQGIRNLVRMETREPNVEGENGIFMSDLIKSSLRMRPNRIVVGEVRDGAALDMLQAMNTGHDGSISTGHANSARDMLRRLETMVLMAADLPMGSIQGQLVSAIDIIVHLGRLRDKRRSVLEISEVLDIKNGEYIMNPIYSFVEDKEKSSIRRVCGSLLRVGELTQTEKLKREGVYEEYEKLIKKE